MSSGILKSRSCGEEGLKSQKIRLKIADMLGI